MKAEWENFLHKKCIKHAEWTQCAMFLYAKQVIHILFGQSACLGKQSATSWDATPQDIIKLIWLHRCLFSMFWINKISGMHVAGLAENGKLAKILHMLNEMFFLLPNKIEYIGLWKRDGKSSAKWLGFCYLNQLSHFPPKNSKWDKQKLSCCAPNSNEISINISDSNEFSKYQWCVEFPVVLLVIIKKSVSILKKCSELHAPTVSRFREAVINFSCFDFVLFFF